MNESRTEYAKAKETEASQESELNYKRAYLSMFNGISDMYDLLEMMAEKIKEIQIRAEDICISTNDDRAKNDD